MTEQNEELDYIVGNDAQQKIVDKLIDTRHAAFLTSTVGKIIGSMQKARVRVSVRACVCVCV